MPGIHLWLILWKCYESVRRYAVSNIATLDLGFSEFAIMELLLHKGPAPVNAIGEKVRLTSGSITTAVDRLESRGLVERRMDAEDGRARVVHLTGDGRRMIRAAFAEHASWMERIGEVLTESEQRQLERLLKKLGRGVAEMR